MKTVLVINDNSPGVVNAAKFAFFIAQKMQANILVANVFKFNEILEKRVLVGDSDDQEEERIMSDLCEYLDMLNARPNDFEPEVNEIDMAGMNENQMTRMINEKNIWMLVKSTSDILPSISAKNALNFNSILNKVRCPLLLVPEHWNLKNIERLVYIADLRYCHLPIVKYLAELARSWHADLSVAHLSKNGIPDMDESYANKVFNDEVSANVKYAQLFFNNIREKNLIKAVDVLINGMHNDLLVMVKNRFHCNEIVGPYLNDAFPSHITAPLLIFPY